MTQTIDLPRRAWIRSATTCLAVGASGALGLFKVSGSAAAGRVPAGGLGVASLGHAKQIAAGPLSIGYFELGPAKGPLVLLLHGFPYDVHSYADVAPILAQAGCHVLVPHLRGHGTTRFLDETSSRSGQQGAIGADVIAFMDALGHPTAVLAGYDWGGRAACVAAALWPGRCAGLVSVNGYLIQDIATARLPLAAKLEWGLWYQHYFQSERGRSGLETHRRDIARILWKNNSPGWLFDETTFQRSAAAFENPDYVEVVVHSYRHRMGLANGAAGYASIEERLAKQPMIQVPTVTLDGDADGVVPATDGKAGASRFLHREHRIVSGAGHNLPQEAPEIFAAAVLDVLSAGSQNYSNKRI